MDTPSSSRSDCPVDRLAWYVNQTLSRTDHAAVEAHLAHCPFCQRDVAEWTALRRAVRTSQPFAVEPRADLFAAIAARLGTHELDQAASEQPTMDNPRQLVALQGHYSPNGHGKPSIQPERIVEDSHMNQIALVDMKRRTALRLNQSRSLSMARSGYWPTLAVATIAFVLFGMLFLNKAPRPGEGPLNSGGLLPGASLTATPEATGTDNIEARVQQKLQTIQSTVPHWIEQGGKKELIAPLMREFDVDLKADKLTEAEAVLDKVLAILGNPPAGTPDASDDIQARLQHKVQFIQTMLPQWIEHGGKKDLIAPLMQEFDADLKAGKLTEAEAVLDKVLAILGNPGSAEDPQARLQHKVQFIQTTLPQWVQRGGNHELITLLMDEFDADLRQGRAAEAEAVLDRVLTILGVVSSSPVPCGTPEAHQP